MNVVEIETGNLVPNGWNPNVEEDEVFNRLVQTIQEDGFDQPIVVAPGKNGKFIIIKGEHRWRAARVLDYKAVPCVVKEDWDEIEQRLRTVRDNLVKGKIDREKFTRLVNDFSTVYRMDHQIQIGLMGFADEREFYKFYISEKERKSKELEDALAESRSEIMRVDNLSQIINHLFTEYGDTLEHGFMFFMWGSQMHLMVEMTGKLKKSMEQVMEECKRRKVDINVILGFLLEQGLKGLEGD